MKSGESQHASQQKSYCIFHVFRHDQISRQHMRICEECRFQCKQIQNVSPLSLIIHAVVLQWPRSQQYDFLHEPTQAIFEANEMSNVGNRHKMRSLPRGEWPISPLLRFHHYDL